MKKEMKKVVCVLLSFMSCLLVSCDKDDDWDKNLGNNLLEGIWTRESSSQKFVATFNADHTSYVCTYHIETEALEHVDLQGKYRVVDESLLVYQSGDKHLFKLSEDGNTVEITYGYGTGNPEAEKTYTYKRYVEAQEPEPEPEEKELQLADVNAAKETLANLKAGVSVTVGMSNWEDAVVTKVSLRKRLTIEDTPMTNGKLTGGNLTFTVPENMPAGSYSLIVAYTLNSKEKEVMFDAVTCIVKEDETPPEPGAKVLVFKNQMMGSSQHRDFGCLLTVTDAGQLDIQTACYMNDDPSLNAEENKKRRSEIDIMTNTYSGPAFALANFDKIAHNLRNYKCNGTNLFTTVKDDAKDKETAMTMFPGYADIQTKFLVLQESIEKEKAIIDLVKNDRLVEISETATPSLFDGSIKIDRITVQSIKPGESVGRDRFDLNGVVVFKSSKNGKIGVMLIREINELDGVSDAVDATIVFDLYYQK